MLYNQYQVYDNHHRKMLNANQIISSIENLYSINNITDITAVNHGAMSNNFIISGKTSRYFLRGYTKNEPEKITLKHKAIEYFYKNGIPVVAPIKNTSNSTLLEVNNTLYAIFPFVEGITVKRGEGSISHAEKMGESLARMHILSINGYPKVFEKLVKIEKSSETILQNIEKLKFIILNKDELDVFDNIALESLELKKHIQRKKTFQLL